MPEDLDRLCIHTITNRPWSGEQCIQRYAAAGVGAVTFWRYNFEGSSPARLGQAARDAGLRVAGVARGGFFTREQWWDDNRRAVDEAAGCGAPVLLLVCGADPRQPLEQSRAQITQRLAQLLPYAAERNVQLAIEPLHPMYADDRSAINTVAQAHAVCDELGSPAHLGIAIDVYHTWWDPNLARGIAHAGTKKRLLCFHICDWLTPTADLLNDRGLMGEGCIDLARIAAWMQAAGFEGPPEVEIFSSRWWAADQDDFLRKVIEAFRKSW
jgi:sugar phosphate isomerase/epimerase